MNLTRNYSIPPECVYFVRIVDRAFDVHRFRLSFSKHVNVENQRQQFKELAIDDRLPIHLQSTHDDLYDTLYQLPTAYRLC